MAEMLLRIEDFETRGDYYKYKTDLAANVLLAYGVVFNGASYGRVQAWCEEDLNLNQDDMQSARNEAGRSNLRLRRMSGPAASYKLSAGALPVTEAEQQVISIVQRLADGHDAVQDEVSTDVAALRVPSTSTEMTRQWDVQMAAYWQGESQKYEDRKRT